MVKNSKDLGKLLLTGLLGAAALIKPLEISQNYFSPRYDIVISADERGRQTTYGFDRRDNGNLFFKGEYLDLDGLRNHGGVTLRYSQTRPNRDWSQYAGCPMAKNSTNTSPADYLSKK